MAVEAWFGKKAHIYLEMLDAAETKELQGEITSFNESGGTRDVEYIYTFGGGTITKEMRTENSEVSFDVLPVNLDWFEPLWGAPSTETVEVIKSDDTTSRDYWRITITWAETFDTGDPPVPATGYGARYTYVDANAVTIEPTSDADGELTATITFKCKATDTDSNPLMIKEYTDNAATTAFPNPYGKGGTRQAFSGYATI